MDTKRAMKIRGQQFRAHPLAAHTTYGVGGVADMYVRPASVADVREIIRWTAAMRAPLFVLGGGANILVADGGIRGVVMDTNDLCGISLHGQRATFGAGIAIQDAASILARNGVGGMHHFYGMPGTLGGAIWMNARCYGVSIVDLLEEVLWYDMDGREHRMRVDKRDFAYKQSPFQGRQTVIVEASVRGWQRDGRALEREMFGHLSDRYRKGHYDGPSAGSVFKNDRRFGKPSGAIIDSLSLRGYRIGGAQVSKRHANIFINAGGASADDFRQLIEMVRARVKDAYNITLEQEVQYVGDW